MIVAADLRHLTWTGRREWVWYRLRRLVVTPAPDSERCVMGGPVGPHIHCPRWAYRDGLWCRHHDRQVRESEAVRVPGTGLRTASQRTENTSD